ncbi:MAG: CPBP family glutamic-type intramembrane protease [Treponema sp.]|nr:CPBP family glutamic-type intramembrane protease [Treponema sp.]
MKLEKYRHPFIFYGVAILVPWAFWFIAGAISKSALWEEQNWLILASILVILGSAAPMAVAFALIFPDREMRKELISACINFRDIHWKWWAFHLLFPTASILAAMAISLLFGYSPGQFRINTGLSFSGIGILPSWLIIFAAPIIEEFGWHTYGIHCVRRRFNLFTTCFVFGLIWAFWHAPLAVFGSSYQGQVVEIGPLHSANFVISLIPYLIIDNWAYYRTKRNMFFQVIFHLLCNFSNEIFFTHPDAKIIQTLIFIAFAAVVVIKDKKYFFDKNYEWESK